MKKNSIKKMLSLVIALAMILSMLAACGGDQKPSQGSSSEPAQSQSAETQPSKKDDDTGKDSTAAPSSEEAGEDFGLPICEEKTTISIWVPMSSNVTNIVDNIGDTAFFKALEERTNVHVEFQHPSAGGEAQAFNLLISSGELPDMVMCSAAYPYPGGFDQAVADGYFMDLTDLIPKYCPNYLKAVESYAAKTTFEKQYLNAIKTEEGRYVGIGQVFIEPQGDFAGYYMRKDWLDDLGLKEPVTYEDWENVLTKFKEEKGATAPLALASTGYDGFNDLPGGYGVNSSFYQIDNKIHYGPMEDGWKDYMTMLNRWYQKGLIDPDFMSGSNFLPDTAMIVTGKTGAFFTMYTLIAMYENGNEDPNALYVPVTAPVLKEGDKNMFGLQMLPGFGGLAISQDSKNAEVCLKWLNYMYSPEGSLFVNYGVEGDTFEYVDGVPQYTEKVTKNEKYSFSEAMCYYTMPSGYLPNLQDWRRELAAVPEKDCANYEVFPSNKTTERSLPSLTGIMNAEESTEYAKLFADVDTIMSEATVGFITGTKPLDEWDSYVEKLKSAGIERLIEIGQGAWDRFMNK